MKTRYLLIFIFPLILFPGCKKKTGQVPTVETYAPAFIASKSATIECRISSNGGESIISCGIYIGESASPDLTGQKLQMGSDTGTFVGHITNLTPAKKYYLRAYASNAAGESLGDEINFTTPPTITDVELNEYETVIIGTQTWMVQNLSTTRFRNNDPVSTTTPATLDITSENSPVHVWFSNGDAASATIYGNLYTWYAITDSRNICPTGWHIPTDVEWTTLENAVGGYLIAGATLKESGNDHWLAPYNTDATDLSCFTALPGGYRPASGSFSLLRNEAHFWSSTESESANGWERMLSTSSYSVTRQGAAKNSGLSVRCIKD